MKKISIIVPVYNEEKQLDVLVDMLMRSPCPIEREWIFVDDCSDDGSLEILEEASRKYGIMVIPLGKNEGKGSALIEGIRHASGDFIMIQDADYEYDPGDVPELLKPLLEDRADVVYGSRFKGSHQVHRTWHYFVNRLLTFLSNLLSGIYVTDMETCYKVFRTDLLKAMNLKSRRFGIEVEMTAYIAKIRPRIFEVPIHYYPRTALQGKKINWKDGLAALWHLIRFNLLTSPLEAFDAIPERYHPRGPHYEEPPFQVKEKGEGDSPTMEPRH